MRPASESGGGVDGDGNGDVDVDVLVGGRAVPKADTGGVLLAGAVDAGRRGRDRAGSQGRSGERGREIGREEGRKETPRLEGEAGLRKREHGSAAELLDREGGAQRKRLVHGEGREEEKKKGRRGEGRKREGRPDNSMALRERTHNVGVGASVPRHAVLYVDDEELCRWIGAELATELATGDEHTFMLKQVATTLPAWILLVVLDASTTGLLAKIVAHVHARQGFLDVVVPEDRAFLLHRSLAVDVLNSNSLYHHLLPGVLLRIRLAPAAEQKENIDTGPKPLVPAVDPCLCHSFPLFQHCFTRIDEIQPPENSALIRYDVLCWQHPPAPAATTTTIAAKPDLLHKKLVLPSQAVTFIIGKRGKSIEQIRQQTSALIKIHEPGPNDDRNDDSATAAADTLLFGTSNRLQLVSIEGAQQDIDHAQALLEEKLRLWRNQQLLSYN